MNRYALTIVFGCMLVTSGFAQEGQEATPPAGVVQGRMIIASDDGTMETPKIEVMSLGLDGATDFFIGDAAGMPAPDVFSLAQNRGVQKEIELVDDQLQQLKKINEEFSKRIQEQMQAIQDNKGNFDIGNAKRLAELIRELGEEKNAKMEEVFLPHQLERLKQISIQTQMKRSGEQALFSNREVIEALDLSEKQQEELTKKAKELKQEMEEKIKEWKEKAREELFDELTREQKEKLKTMLGNDFDLKPTTLRERAMRSRKRRER